MLKYSMQELKINTKTAGIIIIGNEILSGKVRDVNSFFLVTELRALGVNVIRISVIPDDIKIIGEEVHLFSRLFDYVFTSGGIGPTHDDLTIEGISNAFGIKMVYHDKLVDWLKQRYGASTNEAALKMALVPKGSDLLNSEGDNLPVISFKNIIIFPGVPHLLRSKFLALKERFRCSEYFIKRIYINDDEIKIADTLNSVAIANKDLMIGSYPVGGSQDYRVIVTVESKSAQTLTMAINELLKLLPQRVIFKVE